MKTKICSKCGQEKPLTEFHKHKGHSDGYSSRCKECRLEDARIYRKTYKEKIQKYYNEHKEEKRKYNRIYWKKFSSDEINMKKHREEVREYYKKHREERIEYQHQYKRNPQNKKKIRERYRKYKKQRRDKDPRYKLDFYMGGALRSVLGRKKASRRWQELVGYSTDDLMKHLEERFNQNMNWSNYGSYWHVDHIKPKSWFHYETTDDPEFKKCWALNNLQPLEKEKNQSKGARYCG